MAHTQESVLKQLGDSAQITGGAIVVHVDGRNVEVAYVRADGGEFVVTEEGKKLLEAPADKPARSSRKKDAAAEEAAVEEASE